LNQADVVPLRFSQFHANVRKFLEEGPCTNCLSVVPPIVPTSYGMDVDIALRHPFPGEDYYTGFDVRGIVMLEGGYAFPGMELATTRAGSGDWALLNPDGWTPVFNAQDYTLPGILGYSHGRLIPPTWPSPTNTLNAFKAYCSDGQSEEDGGRRAFFAGDQVVRTYELQMVTGEPFRFWYAVDASWEPPTGEPPYELDDFGTEANCPEAFRFDFSVVSGELSPEGGAVTVGVSIWEHQHWHVAYQLLVEAPECSDSVQIISDPPLGIYVHPGGSEARWNVNITNELGGLSPALGTELLVVCINGDDDPLTGPIHAYGRFTMPVSGASPPPEVYSIDPNSAKQGDLIDDALITGANFQPALEVRLEKETFSPIVATGVDVLDTETITCDLDLGSAVVGYWDVVVENPDSQTGTLDNGFMVLTPSGCNNILHENHLGTGNIGGGTIMDPLDICFVHDTGTDVDGEFMAYINGFAGTVVTTYIIDTTTPQEGHGLGGNWGNPYVGQWPIPKSIDISEEYGRFFVVWDIDTTYVEEWTYDGIMLNKVDASNLGDVRALDTDGSGGFWDAYFPEYGFAQGVKHFVPNASMTFSEVPEDHINIPEAWGYVTEVLWIPDETLLILTGLQRGKIRAYHTASSPPELKGEITDIFSGDLYFGTFPDKACDMVADQSDTDLAHCRIVVWGNLQSGGGELVKLDSDLNVIAGPVSVPGHYQSVDMNPDVGHITLSPALDGPAGKYALVEFPDGW
jgi:hypothetical protein